MHMEGAIVRMAYVTFGLLFVFAAVPLSAGAQVIANGGTQMIPGGGIYTNGSGTNGYALWALNGGTITTTGPVSIGTNGSNTYGIVAESGGTISLFSGATVYPNGSNSYALYATGLGSTINATNLTTSTTQSGSYAIVAANGGLVNLIGGQIYTNANNAQAIYAMGAGSTVHISGANIFTSGTQSVGILAEAGGTVSLLDGTITTNQPNSIVLLSSGAGSTITSSGSTLRSNGANSSGAVADNGGLLNLTGGGIATNGQNADGIDALNGSTVTANGVTITTNGMNAFGATAQYGSSTTLTGGSIATQGTGSSVLLAAAAGSSINATGISLGSTGANAYGASILGGGAVTIGQTTMTTNGFGAAAIYGGALDGTAGTFSATDSIIKSNNSYGIYTIGTMLNAMLTGSTLQGVDLLRTANGGILNLVAQSSSHITGAAITDVGGATNMQLFGQSVWTMQSASNITNLMLDAGTLQFGTNNTTLSVANAILLGAAGGTIDSNGFNGTIASPFSGTGSLIKTGAGTATLFGNSNYTGSTELLQGTLLAGESNVFSPYSTYWISPGATLDLGGFNQTIAALNNGGIVNFGPANGAGTLLIVNGNYRGYGGTIIFNTILGTDDSTTDKMLVKGGTAGSSFVTVNNVGGTGAPTTADGIELIQVLGSSLGTFSLTGRVAAGAFEYNLFQGGIGGDATNGNWYLRTDITAPPTPEPVESPVPIPPFVSPAPYPTVPVLPATPSPLPIPTITPPAIPTESPFPLPTLTPVPATPTPGPVPTAAPPPEPSPSPIGPPTVTPEPVPPSPSPIPSGSPAPTPSFVPSPRPTPSTTPTPTVTPTVGPTSEPEARPEEVPDYRVEVPVDMVAQALASNFGLDELGTFHDRTGGDYAGRAWARFFGSSNTIDYDGTDLVSRYNSFSQYGPQYTSSDAGLQAGADFLRRAFASGAHENAGWYLGFGNATAQVQSVYGGDAGTTQVQGYSAGLYWSRIEKGGAYVDAVGQFTLNDVTASSAMAQTLKTSGTAVGLSLESGAKPIELGNAYALEPQAQLVYQRVGLRDSQDDYGLVEYTPSNTLYGRVGARLVKSWSVAARAQSAWVRLNAWDSFNAPALTTFADLDGANPVTLPTALGGSWLQAGAGFSGQLSSHVGLFVTADYRKGLGSAAESHGFSGRAGLRLAW